jgi:hypothetical protein
MTNNTEQRRAFEDWWLEQKDSAFSHPKWLALAAWQAALAQREQTAPSLCTGEEAAELAWNAAGWYVVLSDADQLAAIINADRAKR